MKNLSSLFTSRKFLVSLVALLVVVVTHYIPNFNLDIEGFVGLLLVVISYVFGVAFDPGQGLSGVFKSRKFWATLIGMVFMIVRGLGYMPVLDPEQVVSICVVLSGYILGVSAEGYYNNVMNKQ